LIVLVGSTNPVKIEAARYAFSKYFGRVRVMGMKVDPKVSKQPVEDDTFKGAHNRVLELKRINSAQKLGADFFVGIEGGITKLHSRWFGFGAVCVMDNEGRTGFGTSAHFELPKSVVERLLEHGDELGDVIDTITNEENTKQKAGAIGFFTKNIMDRKDLYVHGVIVALAPFVNKDLYF
jgi:inosine/xanthosine triphosphatase